MKCEKCGTPVISGEEYCRICGNKYNLENEVEVLGDTTSPEVLNIEEIEEEILTVDGPITDSPVEIKTEEFNKEEILKSDEVKKEKPHKKSKMSQAEDVAEMIIKKESFNIFTVVLLILFIASVVLNVLLFVNRDEVEGVTASDNEYKIVYIDGSEYKIKIGDRNNYVDLLLFNYEYNCFVVVELKVTELKKEHIGQIQVYMNYIDENLRKINQGKTIGIIICKQDNKYVIKYCSDDRIIVREYELV